MAYMVWNMTDKVDVTSRFNQITFAKNPHGFVTDILYANFDTEKNAQTVEKMRKRAT